MMADNKLGLFRKRHCYIQEKRTTIKLEDEFWEALDSIASESGLGWFDWISKNVDLDQPNRASKVRVAILKRSFSLAC